MASIAFLVANSGAEQVELTAPWQAVPGSGGQPVPHAEERVKVVDNDIELANTFRPDLKIAHASVADYDGLVLPGAVANPDKLRIDSDAVAVVKASAVAGKPIAVICHGL